MSKLHNRIKQLEKQSPSPELPAWVELLDNGRAILRYEDGRREEVGEAEIPAGVKVYSGGFSPDNW